MVEMLLQCVEVDDNVVEIDHTAPQSGWNKIVVVQKITCYSNKNFLVTVMEYFIPVYDIRFVITRNVPLCNCGILHTVMYVIPQFRRVRSGCSDHRRQRWGEHFV